MEGYVKHGIFSNYESHFEDHYIMGNLNNKILRLIFLSAFFIAHTAFAQNTNLKEDEGLMALCEIAWVSEI